MTRIRRLGAAALGIAMAVTIVVPATPAGAAPSTPDAAIEASKIPENYRKQIPLSTAAGVIMKVLQQGEYPGYAGIELADGHVALWWKGALPARVRTAVAAARAVAPVRVGAAAHSLPELRAAGAELRNALAAQRPRIKYAVDGSRVVVGMDLATGFSKQAVPDVGVPVEFVDQGRKVETSRVDDWAPWRGGADILNYAQSSRCTSGFPVRNGANQRFLLTAGHCGSNGNEIRDGRGEYLGNFTADNDTHDLGLVATPGGAVNQMYVGNLDSNAVMTVEGWDWVWPGEYLCQSGGTSARVVGGPVCNLRVEKFNTDPGDAVEARQVNGQVAVRGGDSGGPVYSFSSSGNAIAKGINCYTYIGAEHILGFQDFGTATRDYGIWIAVP
jgi:streptogrisin D